MSTRVDFQRPEAWHTDPAWLLQQAMGLTRRVVLRHDYMPYEFCAHLYKRDGIGPDSTYTDEA